MEGLDKEIAFLEALLNDPCKWCRGQGYATGSSRCATIRMLEDKLHQLKKKKKKEEKKKR